MTTARRAAIVSPVRTPVGTFGGSLRDVPVEELAADVIKAVLARSGVDPERIDDVAFAQSYVNGETPCVGRWAALQAGLPSGAYFALYDGANTNEAFNQAQQGYNDSGAVPYHLRSPEQFSRFFEGLELVEPGVVPVPHWRPDPDAEPVEIYSYCGVGRKP